MNAYRNLEEFLGDDEIIEAIVFGPWGWGDAPTDGDKWRSGYDEPTPPPVSFDKRGKMMTPNEAKPLMQGWEFEDELGPPGCYAIYAWTNKRVIWVTQYDGATRLSSAPRNPSDIIPNMPGDFAKGDD